MYTQKLIIAFVASIAAGAAPLLAQPSISTVQNNFSSTQAGLPNYGIAQGSLFVIYGSNLANSTSQESSAPPGLPTTVDGVSVSVTVAGTAEMAFLYYISPDQIDAVLPSSVPVGTGTITVTNGNQTSAPAPIPVVQSDFGILTLSGGNGPAAAYHSNYALISGTNAANPGEAILLWGSGVGPDLANNDKTYPQHENNLANTIPIHVYIGGISASIGYAGRSQYPGVDQIVVTIPKSVEVGCNVSLLVTSGNYVSNSTTIPIAASGSVCLDQAYEFTASQVQALSAKSSINIGHLLIGAGTSNGKTSSGFQSSFVSLTPAQFIVKTLVDGLVSYGSCVIVPKSPVSPTYLNAGIITINGPVGMQSVSPSAEGDYRASFPSGFIPSSGGTFTFNNGSGGAQVGPFSNAALNLLAPITWTNMTSISTISLSQGFTVTWTGGSPNSFVIVQGDVESPVAAVSVEFRCSAPQSSGKITVPPELLLAVPATKGTLLLYNYALPTFFSASGLDVGLLSGEFDWSIPVTFQ
jgi:uncharacterized protein (TIGR03437 family)